MASKFHFSNIKRFSSPWKSSKESVNGKYVKSGEDNIFPQHLIELYNQSSIHAAAVNATVEAIIGGGLTSNIDSALTYANSQGETWNDIYTKIAIDYKLHGSFAIEVIWSLDRSRIAEVYHIDFSHIRAREKNERGIIPGYYINQEWARFGYTKQEDIDYLPVYNKAANEDQPNQIFVSKRYRPGQLYYPLPDYHGALKIIELDTNIDQFHNSNIMNGLAPSLAITTFTDASDDDRKAIEAGLRANYGGPENAGGLVYMDVADPSLAPVITPIPQNGADSYYENVNDMTVQKILTAHRITSPMMLGIKTSGQLGGRDEVIDAFLLWNNTVITPMQQDILRDIESLLQVNYPDIAIGVETKQLYDDGTVEEEVVTSVEVTAEEDEQLNENNSNDGDISNIGSQA
jgi:hypothetical protein